MAPRTLQCDGPNSADGAGYGKIRDLHSKDTAVATCISADFAEVSIQTIFKHKLDRLLGWLEDAGIRRMSCVRCDALYYSLIQIELKRRSWAEERIESQR